MVFIFTFVFRLLSFVFRLKSSEEKPDGWRACVGGRGGNPRWTVPIELTESFGPISEPDALSGVKYFSSKSYDSRSYFHN